MTKVNINECLDCECWNGSYCMVTSCIKSKTYFYEGNETIYINGDST